MQATQNRILYTTTAAEFKFLAETVETHHIVPLLEDGMLDAAAAADVVC
jgi:hypothetical protein